MAKGNMLLGKARGKVGSLVYSVLKGQQITRPLNDSPSNPRTPKQSIQRARFAAAVKFFTRGNQNFYKFAYENKKQVESDYNAFMRENVRRAPAISREAFNNYDYPVFAPFLMAKGTLQPLENRVEAGYARTIFYVSHAEELPTTIGGFSELLVQDENFQVGDILTFVYIGSNYDGTYPSAQADGKGAPKWEIRQMIIDPTSTAPIANVLLGELSTWDDDYLCVDFNISNFNIREGLFSYCCVHSRNTSSGLKTSTQELQMDTLAATAYDTTFTEAYKQAVIASWQSEGSVDARPEAILQGSIAYENQ